MNVTLMTYVNTFYIFLQKLRGAVEALYVLCRSNNTRFEFIFTNLVSGYGSACLLFDALILFYVISLT